MFKKFITQERLLELFDYDNFTGHLVHKITKGRSVKGKIAGTLDKHSGYRRIGIDGLFMLAHRLVWVYHFGDEPNKILDHINGNKEDNRIENLRLSDFNQNQQNRRSASQNNKSGYLGVVMDRGKWKAQIQHKGKVYHIGSYDCPKEAHQAYLDRKKTLHPFQTIA